MLSIVRSEEEIDAVLNKAAEADDEGSQWPGMSYEQGVENAIRWITGQNNDNPMDD